MDSLNDSRHGWVAQGHYDVRGALFIHDVLLFDRAAEIHKELHTSNPNATATISITQIKVRFL